MPPTAVIQLVVELGSVTGLPADTVQNVLHCGEEGVPVPADITAALNAVRDFFITNAPPQAEFIGDYISESVSRAANACQVTAYRNTDLTGATPFGSPINFLPFTMTPALSGSPFPEEVAAVVSYNGDLTNVPVSQSNPSPPPATIRPAQRRRGRMFVGPLQASSGLEVGGMMRPSTTFRSDLALAFDKMATTINALGSLYLGVWSRANADVHQAVGGYIDDAWDTQRRRGVKATTRTTFAI